MQSSQEFIEQLGTTVYTVSKRTGISQTALSEIIKGKRNISPTNALKLSKFFGVSDCFFINIQTKYNLDLAKEKNKQPLSKITPFEIMSANREKILKL